MTGLTSDHHNAAAEPVTVTVSRRIQPGREADFEEWIRGIAEVAARFEGQQGLNILRPSEQTGGRYVLIYRFDSHDHAALWENSAERAEWVAKLDGIAAEEVDRKTVTGLEVWLDLPKVPAAAQPPRHKMAVILIVVIFALVYALQVVLGPFIADWPRWAQTLTIVAIQVLSLTYLIMPIITSLLRAWLFRKHS